MFRSVVMGLGLGAALTASAAAAPPLEAYGRLPAVEDLELSPKGDRVAFISVDGEQRQLVVHRLDGKERIRLNAGKAKVRDLSWAGEDHLLITSSTTGQVMQFEGTNEWFQTGAYNLRTRKYVTLLDNTPNTLNSVMGAPVVAKHRGEPAVFVRGITMKGDGSYDLYRVDLDSGRGAIHSEGGPGVGDWVLT
ncbi:MAG: LpqB family beta-propeller domain-containing protein, partial [Pseudomonadota bacterium]|nr:LpqB family beta-propeller domain-containing protein [Pseudomonadota bacterium]